MFRLEMGIYEKKGRKGRKIEWKILGNRGFLTKKKIYRYIL